MGHWGLRARREKHYPKKGTAGQVSKARSAETGQQEQVSKDRSPAMRAASGLERAPLQPKVHVTSQMAHSQSSAMQ